MSIKIITLYLSLFFVLYGCSPAKHYKNLPESSINQNKKSYSTITGTLSILLPDAYNQKRVRKLFKLDSRYSSNIIFSDNMSKKLFVFNYFKSDQKALNDFFKRVKLTGFYDEKNNIEPVFKVVLQGVKPKPVKKWGLNSGWQKIQKETKDPYQPYSFFLKKVISVELTKKRIPSNCYLKGVPCM